MIPDFEKLMARYFVEQSSLRMSDVLVFIETHKALNKYPHGAMNLSFKEPIEDKHVPKDSEVSLNDLEKKFCKFLAKHRYLAARMAGKPNAKQGPQSNEFTDLEGLGGEVAFAKLFNLYPRESFKILPRSTDEDDGDFVLRDGRKVDVKATKYSTGRLQAALWKKDAVDLYALMVGEMPSYRFAGFMPCQELCKESRIDSFPGWPNKRAYMARQKDLVSLDEARSVFDVKDISDEAGDVPWGTFPY